MQFPEIRKYKKSFDLFFNTLNDSLPSECGFYFSLLLLILPVTWIPGFRKPKQIIPLLMSF